MAREVTYKALMAKVKPSLVLVGRVRLRN